MRTTTIGQAEQRPLRSRAVDPAGHRRGDLAAGLAAAAILGQILFAQVTLLAVMILVAVGRVSRWRPHWLAASALASAIWLAVVGPARAAAGYAQGCRRLGEYVVESAAHPGRLAHPAVVVAGATTWLPRQLPLALLAACGEACLVLWLGWWRREPTWLWRPGLVAAGRRWLAAGALAAGHSVTSDGFALGLVVDTGRLASVRWSQAAYGVLLAGQDADQLGLAVACAALRRRKTVLILDCPGQVSMAARLNEIAEPLGVPYTSIGVTDSTRDGAGVRGSPGAAVSGGVAGADVLGPHGAGVAGSVPGADDLGWDLPGPHGAGVPPAVAGGVAGAVGRAIRRRETVLISTSNSAAARQAADELAGVLTGLQELGLRADCVTWIRGAECLEPACVGEILALGPATGCAVVVSTTSPAHESAFARETDLVVVSGPVGTELALALTAPWTDTGPVPAAGGPRTRPPRGLRLSTGPPSGRQSANDALLGAASAISCPMEGPAGRYDESSNRIIANILTCQGGGEFTMLAGRRPDLRSARVIANCRVVPIRPERLR